MAEELLHRGIALAKAGDQAEARKALGQVVKENPQSVMGWLWLASVVENPQQQRYCLQRVLQLNPQNELVKQLLARLETAEPAAAARPQYFLECPPGVRAAVAAVFGPLGYEPCSADAERSAGGPSALLKVCQKIFLSNFGVFDLSTAGANSYLELGVALGLNRPAIAIADQRVAVHPLCGEGQIIRYADSDDLIFQLSQLREQGFPPTSRPAPDYCYFCGRVCESMATPPDEESYLVLNESRMLWRNLMRTLGPQLAQYNLNPVYLTDQAAGPALCDMRRKLLASQFAICHPGALSGEQSYLGLGVAIGGRIPWLLLSEAGCRETPSLLAGFPRVEYATTADLPEKLAEPLSRLLGKAIPGTPSKPGGTALLSLPFWVQLDDWINRVKSAAQAPESVQGRVRIFQYDGQGQELEAPVSAKGLLVGRDPTCDVVVDHPAVSARHFRLLRGRGNKYFVEDLNSKNGTFLNGTRLAPGQKVEVRPNDVIRVPGLHFLVWDERPLPREKIAPSFGDTGLLPPILKVEIPDVAPPSYLSTWDHPLTLTVSLPDGRTRSLLEVQAYYPMGKILSKLVDIFHLPDKKYCFMVADKLIGDDETPLSAGVQKQDVLVMVARNS